MVKKDNPYSVIHGDRNDPLQDLVRGTYKQRDRIEKRWKKQRTKANKRAKYGRKPKPVKPIKLKKHRRFKRKKKRKLKVKRDTYKKIREGRSEGDSLIYYAIHSLIGSGFFIFITFYYNLFNLREITVADILSINFLYSILTIFIVSVTTNILGRFLGHPILTLIYRRTVTKTFWELNSIGINKIGVRYFGATLIASFLFAIGAVAIIQNRIFKENTLESLILTYLIIKFIIYTITKIWVKAKG